MADKTEKKRVNSKQKGSEYERKVAKVLGSFWGEEFHRTPASGGLHWKEDHRVAGDIVTPPDSLWPWVAELKKREEWEFHHLIKATGAIESYWDQVVQDSIRVGLKPLLIFSKNFHPNYVMMTLDHFIPIMDQAQKRIGKVPDFNYFYVFKAKKPTRVIFILEEFMKHITKEDVINAYGLGTQS